jgi:transposase-like protein
MKCPICAATEIIKNGRYRDRQRYCCKVCGRGFSEFSPLNAQTKSEKTTKTKSSRNSKLVSKADRDRIEQLTQECLRLRQELQSQSDRLKLEHQQNTFRILQSLLTQYKSVQQMVRHNPNLPAQNLVALFTPLDRLIQTWEYTQIGEAWQQVPFDPQIHHGDRPDLAVGEPVYIRFVGYQVSDMKSGMNNSEPQILVPAKVSRTLPAIFITSNSNSSSPDRLTAGELS